MINSPIARRSLETHLCFPLYVEWHSRHSLSEQTTWQPLVEKPISECRTDGTRRAGYWLRVTTSTERRADRLHEPINTLRRSSGIKFNTYTCFVRGIYAGWVKRREDARRTQHLRHMRVSDARSKLIGGYKIRSRDRV